MSIRVSNLTIDLPLIDVSANSLRRKIINLAVGGKFMKKQSGDLIIRAIDNVSFEVDDGERVGVVGHNGAGKTTLLRAVAGVFEPRAGKVIIDGKITALFGAGIGLDPEATGLENIVLMAAYLGMHIKTTDPIVEDIIDFCDLNDYIELPVKVYSTGMLGRLAFAVATSFKPDVLILDEWLGAGDQAFITKANNRVTNFVNNAKVVLLASHATNIIEQMTSRVLWLDRGKVKFFGDTKEWKQLHDEHLSTNA
ncbi:MAG: ABC transporter ATP-binding protein [Caulobacterales bacterium]|nr:ABC transporter ATP-binding protein [Caulobacterales bacterium]MCA0373373.1 ABC transporter ATP-binding protein [Pseudomonadota bacterium]